MALDKKYLEEHAKMARSGGSGEETNYEEVGRKLAELFLKAAAATPELQSGASLDEISLSGITVKLKQNKPLICVDVEVCAPIIGCVTSHVGA